MADKQLVNNVSLNIDNDNPYIDIDLSIPVRMDDEDLKKLGNKTKIDLGEVNFSKKTSILIRQIAEEIRKELLSKI